MIIQCEQCQAKFRLDDSRVTDKGVKVRCAKCRHVFTVKNEQPDVEPQPDFGAMLDRNAALDEGSSPVFEPQDTNTVLNGPASETPSEGLLNAAALDVPRATTSYVDVGEDGLPDFAEDTTFKPGLTELKSKPMFAPAETDDFSGFDFDDTSPFADATVFPTTDTPQAGPVTAPAATDDFSGFNFDDINPFADTSAFPANEAPQAGPVTAPVVTDDFSDFDFDDTSPFSDAAALPVTEVPQAEPASAPVAPDDFSGFDFDDDLFAAPVTEKPSDPSRDELTFDHQTNVVDEEQSASSKDFGLRPDDAFMAVSSEPIIKAKLQKEKLPPLSITSRNRQSPWITGVIAVIGVLIALGLAFYGYSLFLVDKGKGLQESEKISIRSLNASFVKNPGSGDLLVITGEALNNFKKPRASIQVKGMIYGQNGQVMVSKNVYAGNPLTKDQLATMPLDKIEAVMSNQFGDSLANLEVAPGKSIPFVIVIAQPPADGKDYGVEPVGSVMATTKQ